MLIFERFIYSLRTHTNTHTIGLHLGLRLDHELQHSLLQTPSEIYQLVAAKSPCASITLHNPIQAASTPGADIASQ